jgi:hypothetical protein
VLSLCLDLSFFLRGTSMLEDRGEDRLEAGSVVGKYREDLGLFG